jgi:probable F420-dependent oxidoreductase
MDRFTLPPIGVWGGELRHISIADGRRAAAELEELAYGAVWLPESDSRDVFVNVTELLSATEALVAGTSIANIWARDALAMACAAKAVTEAYPERFVLGIGVSNRKLVEDSRGHRFERPLAAMHAYLDAMDNATYSAVEPSTPVRMMLAALGPKMIALAAKRTAGAIPYMATPEHTAQIREAMPDGLVCVLQAVVLEENPGRSRELARRHTAPFLGLEGYAANLRRLGFTDDDLSDGGSDRLVDGCVAHGSIDVVLARVRAQIQAGADHVCLRVVPPQLGVPPFDVWRDLSAGMERFAGLGR